LDHTLYGSVTVLHILIALVVALIGGMVIKIVTMNIKRFGKEKLTRDQIKMLNKAVFFVVILVAIIIILPLVGIDPTGLMVAGGVVAIVIGFASQSVVTNLLSGLFLLIEKQIKIGDLIQVDGELGYVEDLRVMSTTIRTLEGTFVRIPNEKLFTNKLTNYVKNKARRFQYTIGIRYKDDADKAVEIITRLIEEHPMALANPAPEVFVDQLGDNSVNLSVRIWSPATEWWDVKKELLWQMKTALEAEGIYVPFPQRELWFNSELETVRK
jgi:small-conductance mechanosensitive channel